MGFGIKNVERWQTFCQISSAFGEDIFRPLIRSFQPPRSYHLSMLEKMPYSGSFRLSKGMHISQLELATSIGQESGRELQYPDFQ